MGSQCGHGPHRARAPARAPGAGGAAQPRPGSAPVTAFGPPSWPV